MLKRLFIIVIFCNVANSQSSRDSIIYNWYLQGKISRDSLLHKLYDIGRIDYPVYIRSLSKEQRLNEERLALQELRNKAHYKFVVEYLLQKIDSTQYDSLALQQDFPNLLEIRDSSICESYSIGGLYFLYKFPSLDDRTNHYLLERYYLGGVYDLFIFGSDTTHPIVVDSLVSLNGEFTIKHLKGSNTINIPINQTDVSVGIEEYKFKYVGRPNQRINLTR
jgi:hypothetical protein